MKSKKLLVALAMMAIAVAMVFAIASCGDKAATVKDITLNETTKTMAPGETFRLEATVGMSDGSEGKVDEWTTSDDKVVTVIKGVVSAKGSGTATVTAKAGDKTATCTVKVEDIKVEISKTTLSLERYATDKLTATVKKDGTATSDKIEWSSSDTKVVSVDENGNIRALQKGEADITATRAGSKQTATCKVTVTWTEPAGYKKIDYYEQNKVPAGTWGYWNDPANYVAGTSEMIDAYYQDSADSDAGKVNFMFAINSRQEDKPGTEAIIQITYRNAKGEVTAEHPNGDGLGTLETNHNYEISFEITSSVAGKIKFNSVDGSRAEGVDAPEATLEANKPTALKTTFRHGDWGTKYPEGVYDNVESAGYFLLGYLGEPGEVVTVSIDKIKWTDKGEAETKSQKPDFSVKIPDLSATEAVALNVATEDEHYTITKSDEGKSYNVVYTGMQDNTYKNIEVALPAGVDVKACNTFAVTVKNNGSAAMKIRFDIKATTEVGANNVIDCAVSSVATEGTPQTNLEWGGTSLSVAAGATVTLYITYDGNGEKGDPTAILMYFDSLYAGDGSTHDERSGDVTISDFKFAKVGE